MQEAASILKFAGDEYVNKCWARIKLPLHIRRAAFLVDLQSLDSSLDVHIDGYGTLCTHLKNYSIACHATWYAEIEMRSSMMCRHVGASSELFALLLVRRVGENAAAHRTYGGRAWRLAREARARHFRLSRAPTTLLVRSAFNYRVKRAFNDTYVQASYREPFQEVYFQNDRCE